MTPHDRKTVKRIAAKALRSGGIQRSISTVEWDIAGRCERPQFVKIDGQERTYYKDSVRQRRAGYNSVEMYTRCRQCGPCLRYRARVWQERAEIELRQAQRTWFCTFTLSPESHHRNWLVISRALRKSGVDPLEVSAADAFKLRASEAGKLFTLLMKRLRKKNKSQIRYLLVVESHKNGLPHLHALMHEVSGSLTYRQIADEWDAGFMSAKLVDDTNNVAARYITKYLAKQALSRIRPSVNYGRPAISTLR